MTPSPLVSVAIATLNSDRTLAQTLKSIRRQKYPQSKIEILVIDGGSIDQTLKIARQYKAKIIPNPKVDLIYAKHIAFLKANGQYLIFLDSDESLVNPSTIKQRLIAFSEPKVRATLLSGYRSPKQTHPINHYINEFGDPFSLFVYRQSKGDQWLIQDLTKNYPIIVNKPHFLIYDFTNQTLPLIELWAGGCMIDLTYIRRKFPQIKTHPELVAHLFYLLNDQNQQLAVMKHQPTIHNSSASYKTYLKKIRSRIKNNIFGSDMGEGGFSGRTNLTAVNQRKYLFIPYSLSVIWPLIDGMQLAYSHRQPVYLFHPLLCLYTTLVIGYYYIVKSLHLPTKLTHYGQ